MSVNDLVLDCPINEVDEKTFENCSKMKPLKSLDGRTAFNRFKLLELIKFQPKLEQFESDLNIDEIRKILYGDNFFFQNFT